MAILVRGTLKVFTYLFCLQLLQVGFEVKVFDIPACFPFLYGSTESRYLLLIFFQPP